ncbi:MAG: hypothetical protein CMP20_10365 [Rickettsiales bacterium]|nr:hypothetical protein [Rickettsiales bacterium]
MSAKRELPTECKKEGSTPAKRQKPLETPEVPGLVFIKEFVSFDEEQELVENIDAEDWFEAFPGKNKSRRVQHYGFEYDYKQRTVKPTEPMPEWAIDVATKIDADAQFDQLIVNEYLPGQGITPHTDAICFGPKIASLSLGSHCVMRFTKETKVVDVYLPRRSLVVLTGPARSQWKHQILSRKEDPHPLDLERTLARSRRVSVTLRTVL